MVIKILLINSPKKRGSMFITEELIQVGLNIIFFYAFFGAGSIFKFDLCGFLRVLTIIYKDLNINGNKI
jgi:hypothetical protein